MKTKKELVTLANQRDAVILFGAINGTCERSGEPEAVIIAKNAQGGRSLVYLDQELGLIILEHLSEDKRTFQTWEEALDSI